jgi:hypothetical protein
MYLISSFFLIFWDILVFKTGLWFQEKVLLTVEVVERKRGSGGAAAEPAGNRVSSVTM